MSGRIITIILKKGPGFPLFGSPPTFWPLMVGPELSWCLWVLMCYNECIMSLKVPSKANLSPYCARSVLTSFCVILNGYVRIPWWYNGKESACQYRRCRRFWFDPWVGRSLVKEMASHSSIMAWRIPWASPWGHKESDTTEQLSLSHSTDRVWASSEGERALKHGMVSFCGLGNFIG